MQQAMNAYARVSQTALSPRELEATVLMKAATRLQGIRDNWEAKSAELGDALRFNQKLWTILATSVTDRDSQVPPDIRQQIVDLALFIFQHTIDVQIEPEPQKLAVLVNINRELAAGLRPPLPQAA
jgi:flagellar protein FlaF